MSERDISPSESKALEEFLMAFAISLKSALMYFREHPHFLKNIQELRSKLAALSSFRNTLKIGVSSDALLIDGEYFKKNFASFKEIAYLLHKKRIKSLSIDTSLEAAALEEFVFSLASLGRDPQVSFPKIKGIEIEELDYSLLLSASGKHPPDIWKALLSRNSEWNPSSLDYLISNLDSIVSQVKSVELDENVIENLFVNLEKAITSLEKNSPQEAKEFIQSVFTNLINLPSHYAKIFLEESKFNNFKDSLSKYLDEETFFNEVVKQLVFNREISSLLPEIYKDVFKDNKTDEDLTDEVLNSLRKSEFFNKKKDFLEILKELFLKDKSNNFISLLYKKTLSLIGENLEEDSSYGEIFQKELSPEEINQDYFYVLLELIFQEDNPDFLNTLISNIEKMLYSLSKGGRFKFIWELARLLEEKIKTSNIAEVKNLLTRFLEKLYSYNNFSNFLDNLESVDLEGLRFFAQRIKELVYFFVNRFFEVEEPNLYKKLKTVITELAVADPEILYILRDRLRSKKSLFFLREVVGIICRIKSKEAQQILEDIYQENKNLPQNLLEILKIMRENSLGEVNFLKDFFLVKNYPLRREAILCFLTTADTRERQILLDKLFFLKNFLGFKDGFVSENIDIFRETKTREVIPYLKKILLRKPYLFRKKRDRLRVKSLRVIMEIEPSQLRDILPILLKDRNKEIRELVSNLANV